MEVVNWIKNDGSEPITINEANFPPSRLQSLRDRKSAAFKGVCALLLQNGSKDFYSDMPIDMEIYFNTNVDIHHIFPKKWCDRNDIDDDKCDSIINKTAISRKTNSKIKDLDPRTYLKEIERDARIKSSKMDHILESHLIKPSLIRSNDFVEFFSLREKEILKIIGLAMDKNIIESMEPLNASPALLIGSSIKSDE